MSNIGDKTPETDLIKAFNVEQHTKTKLYRRFLEEGEKQTGRNSSVRCDSNTSGLVLSKDSPPEKPPEEDPSTVLDNSEIPGFSERIHSYESREPQYSYHTYNSAMYPPQMFPPMLNPSLMYPMAFYTPYAPPLDNPYKHACSEQLIVQKDNEISGLRIRLESLTLDLQVLEQKVREADDKCFHLERSSAHLRGEASDSKKVNSLERELGHLKEALVVAHSELSAQKDSNFALENKLNSYKRDIHLLQKDFDTSQEKLNGALHELDDMKSEYSGLLKALINEKASSAKETHRLANQLQLRDQKEAEMLELKQQLEEAYKQIEDTQNHVRVSPEEQPRRSSVPRRVAYLSPRESECALPRPSQSVCQLENIEYHLLSLQQEKVRLEGEYSKLPEYSRSLLTKKRRVSLGVEIEIVDNNIRTLKTKLRSLQSNSHFLLT